MSWQLLADFFQLSLHTETAFTQSTGSPVPSSGILLVRLVLYGHLICVWACRHSLWRLCPCQSHSHSPLVSQSLMRLWSLSTLWSCLQLFHSSGSAMVSPVALEGGLAGSCSHCLAAGSQHLSICSWHVFIAPNVDLWSLLALTSWESMQVIMLQWWSNELLGEQSCFFFVEMARNSANGHPTEGNAHVRGRSDKRDMPGRRSFRKTNWTFGRSSRVELLL